MWWHLARRLQLSPWESSVVSRLLTPTHSFLARSKSTAALSGDTGKAIQAALGGEVKSSFWSLSALPRSSNPTSIHSGTRFSLLVLALFHLHIHPHILSGHQMPGRQMTSLTWSDGLCQSVRLPGKKKKYHLKLLCFLPLCVNRWPRVVVII